MRKRVISFIAFIRRLSLVLLCCFFSHNAYAFENGRLILWTRADDSLPLLRSAAERFTQKTGIPVEVTAPPGMLDRFQFLAESGQGPDMLIWAHDRVGEWLEMGLIQAIKPSPHLLQRIPAMAWQGFTLGQSLVGYPLALESPALIVNPNLVPVPPRRFEEIPALEAELSKQGVKSLLWEYSNAYYTWAMLSAGAQAAPIAEQLKQAVVLQNLRWLASWFDNGLLPKGSDYIDMERGFNRGKVAMMISGPWAWNNLRRSKTPFTISPLPSLHGQPCRPFVGVTGLVLAARSPNLHLAKKFIEEELYGTETQLSLFRPGGMRGVPADKTAMRQLYADPLLRKQYQIIKEGQLMPNTPDVRLFWSTVGTALFNLGLGRQTADEAYLNILKRMQ